MNLAVLALIITNIIWGASPPIYKLALENIPPFTLAFMRFFIAALIFLPLSLKFWRRITLKDMFYICLSAFFGITVNISFFFLGLQDGISINSTLIASAGPVFIFLLAIIFFKEKFHPKIFIGMMIALIGVLVIVFSPYLNGYQDSKVNLTIANLFFVIATIGAVIDPLIAKKVLGRVHFIQFSAISFLFASWSFLPMMYGELQTWSFSQINLWGLIGILYGAILASTLAYTLFYYGISKIVASEIGLFMYIDPVITVMIAMPLLGEYPSKMYFFGAAFVILGIYLAEGRIHWHPLHKLKTQNLNDKV